MAYRGWVFVQTQLGQGRATLDALNAMDMKGSTLIVADTVTGPHDLIVYLEAESIDVMAQTVQAMAAHVPGIERTITCHRIGLE